MSIYLELTNINFYVPTIVQVKNSYLRVLKN
jgi:hypothetical protein